jgi:hypothetical protein
LNSIVVLFVGSPEAPTPTVGTEAFVETELPLPDSSNAFVGEVIQGLGPAPWPPDVVEALVTLAPGGWSVRCLRVLDPIELYGPRADEVATTLARIENVPWFLGPTGPALEEAAKPILQQFARGVARSAPCPVPRIRVVRSLLEARKIGLEQVRAPAMIQTVKDDVRARIDALDRASDHRARGASAAGFAASYRLAAALTEKLFRAALIEAASPVRLAELSNESHLPIPNDASTKLLAPLPTLGTRLWKLVVLSLLYTQRMDQGVDVRGAEIMAEFVEDLAMFSVEQGLELDSAEWKFLELAWRMAWQPVAFLLSTSSLVVSRHLQSMVLRPTGAYSVWTPWIDLLGLGAPPIGFTSPSTFALLDVPMGWA